MTREEEAAQRNYQLAMSVSATILRETGEPGDAVIVATHALTMVLAFVEEHSTMTGTVEERDAFLLGAVKRRLGLYREQQQAASEPQGRPN